MVLVQEIHVSRVPKSEVPNRHFFLEGVRGFRLFGIY